MGKTQVIAKERPAEPGDAAEAGQAAMEFLLTYGWAIVVGVTAIVALNYYGLLDVSGLSSYIPPYCVMDTGLSCLDHSVRYEPSPCPECGDPESNTLELRIKNNLGYRIKVLKISVPEYGKEVSDFSTYYELANGQKSEPNDPLKVDDLTNGQPVMQKGERYILDIIIEVENTESGLTHQFHATLKGKIE